MSSTGTRTMSTDHHQRKERWRLLIGPAASLAFGVVVLVLSHSVTEPDIGTGFSPRWWPEILGAIICVLSVGVAIKEFVVDDRSDDEVIAATRLGRVRVAAVIATTFAYGVLWYFLDFRVATFVLVAVLAFIIGGRGWRVLLLFPALVTALLYVLFVLLLKVPL